MFEAALKPYAGADFFQFFAIFLGRLFLLFRGEEMASDEIQFFVLATLSIASALIGTFLVLRKMTMLANALSHTSLIGIASTYLLFYLFQSGKGELPFFHFIIASTITGLITAFLSEFLTKVTKLQEDASIGLVFTTLFAAGILMVTLFARDSHIGTELIMGNVDSLQKSDLRLSLLLLLATSLFVLLFFRQLKITTFDPFLSKTFGLSPLFFNYMLTLLTAATTISSFRAVGVLMVLAFLTGPTLIARFFTHSLATLLLLSSFIGILASLVGVALSRHILTTFDRGLSTGGITVCVLILFYLLALFISTLLQRKILHPNPS